MKKRMAVLLAALLVAEAAMACTSLIVTRGASADSSNMVSYAADSHTRYGFLSFLRASRHGRKDVRYIYEWGTDRFLGEIPQVRRTFNVVGNMNEKQLAIAESTWGGLESHRDTSGILDYGSLIYIALERCSTAREAIRMIDSLTAEYGYASTGESLSISDKDEVWIMEMISRKPVYDTSGVNLRKGIVWVARRIPDGCISAHANAARITYLDTADSSSCMYSSDLFEYLSETGLYSGSPEEFSFADTFCPLDFMTARGCEARVWSFFNRFAEEDMSGYVDHAGGKDLKKRLPLYVKPSRRLTVKDVADMMRDHYEDTPFDMRKDPGAGGNELPYRWRPLEYSVDGRTYFNERAIATQQTAFWFVAQSRPYYPDHIGGLLWFGVDDAATSPLTPVYASSTRISEYYSEYNGSMVEYSPESMFWLVNRVAQFAYLRYNHIGTEVRAVIDEHEKDMMAKVAQADRNAYDLYIDSSVRRSVNYLTGLSVTFADYLFYKWKKLDEYLLVKYIDGNTKKQNPDGSFRTNGFSDYIPAAPEFMGYTDAFRKQIAESEAGERLMKGRK